MNTISILKKLFISTLACCSLTSAHAQTGTRQQELLQSGKQKLSAAPLLFTENNGQAVDDKGNLRPDILFTAHSGGAKVYLTATGIHYQFAKTDYPEGYQRDEHTTRDHSTQESLRSPIKTSTHRFTLSLEGSNPHPRILKEGISRYTENFYLAHCPQGITGVHTYERVVIEDVYPGVDWVVYSSKGSMEYDFVVKPGAEPSQIKLKVQDADAASIAADGALVIQSSLGTVKEAPPISFSEGKKVATQFVQNADGSIGFALNAYDKTAPLTIDPSVTWATFYGSSGDDDGDACAVDGSGNVYLAGTTSSVSGIASSGGFQSTNGGGTIARDAFLVKFNSAGARLWATYYGGAGIEVTGGCATDAAGNVYLAGTTMSASGIASGGAQNIKSDTNDAFLVKFDAGGARQWATYLGGIGNDYGNGCATDKAGNVFLSGTSSVSTGLGSGGFQNTSGGASDAFLAKYNAAGIKQWSTYYGGAGLDYGYNCSADTAGNVYLAGITGSSSGIASPGALQAAFAGGYADAFLVKFDPSGVRLWATYYGGTDNDGQTPAQCAADGAGNVFLSGTTRSVAGIASGGFQNTFGGFRDGFLVKFNPAGTRQWATYYGGSGDDLAQSCAVDASGNVYLSGGSGSTTGIASGGFLNSLVATAAGFIAKFDGSGARLWGSYCRSGGDNVSNAANCATDGAGNVYLCGVAIQTSISTSGGFQNTFGGGNTDAVLTKISDNGMPQGVGSVSATWGNMGLVYPNPAGKKISFAANTPLDAAIYTADGRLMLQQKAVGSMDISTLPSGLYFITLKDEQHSTTMQRFVKQ